MFEHTARLAATWAKITLTLIAGAGLVILYCGWDSTETRVALITAGLLELLTLRGLARQWLLTARCSWWWLW